MGTNHLPDDYEDIPADVFADPNTILDWRNDRVIAGDGRRWDGVKFNRDEIVAFMKKTPD